MDSDAHDSRPPGEGVTYAHYDAENRLVRVGLITTPAIYVSGSAGTWTWFLVFQVATGCWVRERGTARTRAGALDRGRAWLAELLGGMPPTWREHRGRRRFRCRRDGQAVPE